MPKTFFKAISFVQILLLASVLFLSADIYAEIKGKTVITSVRISGQEIAAAQWENLEVASDKTIVFRYSAEALDADQASITFRIYLNGKIFASRQGSEPNNEIAVGGLAAGKTYVLRIQAFANNDAVESTPVAVSFKVINSPDPAQNEDSMSQMVLYVALALFVVLIILLAIIWLRRKAGNKSSETENPPAAVHRPAKSTLNAEFSASGPRNQSDRIPSESTKQIIDEDLVNEYNRLNSEHADLEYSYKRLKKECDNLRETNEFLNNQVQQLKSNINDLEKANSQLAQQKEKLLESKRQLEELQTQKDELFAIAIHDIKNPAAAIRGYVELLESYDLNAQEQQEVMQSLVDTSSHIISLAHQMTLAVIKQKPEPSMKFEVGSLKEIADSVCLRNMGYAVNKQIKLINQTSPNTPETAMDLTKIEEVLDNLVNNAIKYAPPGTVVQVRSYFSGSKITVEVIDNGVGLSPEDARRAFEKGALLTPEPTAGEPRSGLGLWIVKRIIEEHGGNVWLKSKLGVGSTFAFELPIKR